MMACMAPIRSHGHYIWLHCIRRLTMVATLTLTLVAYKFVIDDRIPNVHYLTLLDKLTLSTFAFLVR